MAKDEPLGVWEQTTTLYTRIWKGRPQVVYAQDCLQAKGILRLGAEDFARQMKTFKSNGADPVTRAIAFSEFMSIFAANLWHAYAPDILNTDAERWNEHIIPLEATYGVKNAECETIKFNTEDGLALSLQRFSRNKANKNKILLLHGFTNSTDMFIMPEHNNLVNYLLDQGYDDVFSLDWRGSKRFTYNLLPNKYNLDYVARYDVKNGLEKMRQLIGADSNIHVIAHCLGSVAVASAISAGLAPDITSFISNSVSLTPKVSPFAKAKITVAPDIVEKILRYPYLSPAMSYLPKPGFGKWLPWIAGKFHRECEEPACHMVSFMWGFGFPAAFEHKNISPITHRRLKDLFGGTSMNFYRHIRKMIYKEEAIPYKREHEFSQLPSSYLENYARSNQTPPTLLVSGDKNQIFPGSNQKTEQRLHETNPSCPVRFCEIPGYGHQDIFIGMHADQDVFGVFLSFLKEHS